jgi:hypothetical protein
MTSAMFLECNCQGAGTSDYPPNRGPFRVGGFQALTKLRLSTDQIGSHVLTLTNVVVGSRILIAWASTETVVHNDLAATSTVVITVPVYGAGQPGNNLAIRIRKASAAPFYQSFETQLQVYQGASSIFVQQLSDQ